nr:putative CENPB DNA-binding domain-containing protein 1 [Dermatophagoides farinae]XP_046908653.1 putative CENPB DNA-binding domain-containing protein 1 [Dermatophagoides farinae]
MPKVQLSTSIKRCRKSITLETKLEVLRRIEAREKIVEICKAMGLAKSTIQTIRDKKEEIKAYSQSAAHTNVARLTRQRYWVIEKMEKLLFIWIQDNNKRKIPMNQMTIQQKALSIFENLKNDQTDESVKDITFQASRGWFEKFKNRFNLRNLKLRGDVTDLLEADRESLSYEELIQLQTEPQFSDETESEPVVSKKLTSKNLSNAFSHIEQAINIIIKNDPDEERSAKFSQGQDSLISCYKSLKNEMDKKARQATLDSFFKPIPSIQAKNDVSDV